MTTCNLSEEYVEGFVKECNHQGLSVQEAAVALSQASTNKALENDSYRAGFEGELAKEAGWGKMLGKALKTGAPAAAGIAGIAGTALYMNKKPAVGKDINPYGMNTDDYANSMTDVRNAGVAEMNGRSSRLLDELDRLEGTGAGAPGEVEGIKAQLRALKADKSRRQTIAADNVSRFGKAYDKETADIAELKGNRDAWWRKWVPFTDSAAEVDARIAKHQSRQGAFKAQQQSNQSRGEFLGKNNSKYVPTAQRTRAKADAFVSNDFQRYE